MTSASSRIAGLTPLLPRVLFVVLVAAATVDAALAVARLGMQIEFVAATAVAIGALAATFKSPPVGLVVFVLTTYGFFRYGAHFDDVLAADLPNRIVFLTLAGWLVHSYETRSKLHLHHPLTLAMVAFVIWVGVSILAAWTRDEIFEYSMWHHPTQYAQALVLFLIAVHGLRRIDVAWAFGLLLCVLPTLQALQRATRGFYLDNDLPLLCAILLPLAAVGTMRAPHWAMRLGFAGLGLDMLRIVAFAQNRAAAVGLAAAVVALWWNSRHRLRWALAGLPAIFLCSWLLVPQSYINRFAVLWAPQAAHQTSNLDRATVKGRLSLWDAATRMIAAHPIVGVGAGNFHHVSERYLSRKSSLPAHNSLLNVAAETGIPGALLYLALFIGGLVILRRAAVSNETAANGPLACALQGCLAAYLVGGLFMSRQDMQLAYLMLGWALALRSLHPRSRALERHPPA